ncbi:hypothetical protein HU200_039789 [Digitaria exilis]|uniref:DUF4005 domain-containing protein n=1 Tax=Digitaria exilis TaxID=1010633 RepID=A0A835EH31_9POAL|nr:hypothetical protein HU200_039789 [Digitaria exilis]CAB3466429.1 unnamed protein product [Digitaria exilis]
MGKAGRWLRNFFLSARKGRKSAKDKADADCQSVLSAPLSTQAAAPSVREKRRWSFRRPATKVDAGAASGGHAQGPLASSSSHCFSEAEVHVVVVQEQDHHDAVVAEVPTTAPAVASLPPPASVGGEVDEETAAAIMIQSAYRSYLARKALCALRGMVKLQAMVRGQLVRRQADVTLRRMQALVDAQRRARAERLRLLAADDDASQQRRRNQLATTTSPAPVSRRRSPQQSRPRKERGTEEEEHVKVVVEVDNGGAPRRGSRCHATTPAAKAEVYKKVSPTPSALTDASARTVSVSGRLDDASLGSPSCEPRRRAVAPPPFGASWSPSYMANTKSWRAKARSQSAPRQRLSSASEPAVGVTSPSPSCGGEAGRPPSAGGLRRRSSLDPLDLPGAGGGALRRGVGRCAARARASPLRPGGEGWSSSSLGRRGSVHAPWQG